MDNAEKEGFNMASTLYEIPEQTWVELEYSNGSIFHKSGGGVVYLEADAEPTDDYDDLPVMKSTDIGEEFQFYSVPDGESIWAYAPNESAYITVTPSE